MKLGRIVLACLCLACVATVLIQPWAKADDVKPLHLAFITNNAADFWTIARAGTQKAVEETPGIDVNFQIPGDATAATQKRIIDDLLVKGLDGMTISPVDPTNETPMLNDVAKQCLVFCHDSDAPDSDRACYVGTNNRDAGKQAGDLIKQACPGGGKIMLFVGNRDAQNARDRLAGIQDSLNGSNITIIDVRTDDTDAVRAQKNAEDTLVKYPDISCLVGLYNYNGPAILNAVRSAGQTGKVKIVCFDENTETLDGVASGDIYGTVVQQPFEFGKQAITRMAQYLGGDKAALAGGKQIVSTRSLKKDDIAGFKADLAKILGK